MIGRTDRPLWTRRLFLWAAMAGTVLLGAGGETRASEMQERADLASIFKEQNVPGTFVLYDPAADRIITVNAKRAERRFIPASTFKIANSLIALETGVVKD